MVNEPALHKVQKLRTQAGTDTTSHSAEDSARRVTTPLERADLPLLASTRPPLDVVAVQIWGQHALFLQSLWYMGATVCACVWC